MAEATVGLLQSGRFEEYGALLAESWEAKKSLARGITNSRIDEWYELALAHGARGGKITGAGGGGFLMLYCEEPYQEAVTSALEATGLVRMDFRFERSGAVVLMDALPRVRPLGNPERIRDVVGPAWQPVTLVQGADHLVEIGA
jgi:galactokinase/mevalonate kinase-like predicted kinase